LQSLENQSRFSAFWLIKKEVSFLIDKSANALHPGQLVRPDSAPLAPYR
jgi:hypothetical protein